MTEATTDPVQVQSDFIICLTKGKKVQDIECDTIERQIYKQSLIIKISHDNLLYLKRSFKVVVFF